MMGSRVLGPLVAAASMAVAACALFDSGAVWHVTGASEHGGYLLVAISSGRENLSFVLDSDERCRTLLRPEGQVSYVAGGPFGHIDRGDERCTPLGIGQFASWVRRSPRPQNLPSVPRAEATFRKIAEDTEVILVRGNFPLAGLVGFPGGADSVAWLPNSDLCRKYVDQRAGPMLYRRTSDEVIWLGGADARCAILALARPLVDG